MIWAARPLQVVCPLCGVQALCMAHHPCRALHQIPELAYQEHKTSQYVRCAKATVLPWAHARAGIRGGHAAVRLGCELPTLSPLLFCWDALPPAPHRAQLDELGVSYRRVDATGVVAELGPPSAVVVGLRADMDGLPIEEPPGLPFRSKHDGRMHACGHDAHTAMMLGAAKLLAPLQEQLPGRVRLLFQPAEVRAAGAWAGARPTPAPLCACVCGGVLSGCIGQLSTCARLAHAPPSLAHPCHACSCRRARRVPRP